MRTQVSRTTRLVSQNQKEPIGIISIDTCTQKIISLLVSEKQLFAKFILNNEYTAIPSEIYQRRNPLFLSS